MSIKPSNIPISVLNLVPVYGEQTHKEAIDAAVEDAQLLDELGYHRLWISEHHNTESLVSSATVLLMQHLLASTQNIRIGSGGIMLPNHTPLIVAEQVGTLETLYPNRVDLGLGRAPGTDQQTARALRRDRQEKVEDFPNDVQELHYFLSRESIGGRVRAIPGEGTEVPMYLLGSSTFSAQLAASLGLPYVFASHFAPRFLHDALNIYHNHFKASTQLEKPYAMAGINVVIAKTDEEAQYLATTGDQFALSIIRNRRGPLQPPTHNMDDVWSAYEEAHVRKGKQYSFVGSPETVRKGIESFIKHTGVDELIVASYIYDQEARHQSFRMLKELWS